jgi:hypothetical protein
MGSLEAGMTADGVRGLLASVASGRLSVQEAEARLAHLPFEDLGFARVDHHRTVRGAGPEVVYARSKTPEQVAAIATALLRRDGAPVLVTKAGDAHAHAVLADHPDAGWHARSGMIVLRRAVGGPPGTVLVVSAGSGDLATAEEASVTAEAFGCRVELLAALLGMLNSCALGVSVVNIDNGFGAGVIAARILRLGLPSR